MYYLPQEIEVWYIIPAIRSWISKCMIEDFDASYEKIGKVLGVSRAAISQYVKGKRAAKIKLPNELGPKILASCKVLHKDETKAIEEIDKILEHIRNKGLTFSVCGKLKEGTLEDCSEVKFTDGNYRKVR
jgi:predicted transcriptional regulator